MRATEVALQTSTSASMGPQLVSCGCLRRAKYRALLGRASMGPQLVSCGCLSGLGDARDDIVASMGPQLVSCGCAEDRLRAESTSCFNGAAARELRMPLVANRAGVSTWLQWGRSS
mgnify:CR=1 FL=1